MKGPSPQRALSEGEARRLEMEAAAVAQAVDVNPDELPTINDPEVVHDDTDEREATSSPWGTVTPWGTTNPGPPLKRRLMIRAMRMLFVSPEPTDRLHHGERMRLAGRDWFVVHTPGHTVDHLCAWDPETGTLLTGDHVLPSITPHVSGVTKADSLKSYLATLDLVARLEGVQARSARARASRSPTCPAASRRSRSTTRSAWSCCGKPRSGSGRRSVQQLSREVFPKRHWGVMAESETFAHLEHLAHAGEAERWEEGGVLMFRVAAPRRDEQRVTRPTIADESVELLSQLIRNQCVNDGDDDSGFESRSADTLAQFLGTSGLDIERYAARPGREKRRRAHRRQRPDGTDPAADGSHRRRAGQRGRLAARSVRCRARRR